MEQPCLIRATTEKHVFIWRLAHRTDRYMTAGGTDIMQFATKGRYCKDVHLMTRNFKKLSAGLRVAKRKPVCAHTSTHLSNKGSSVRK